MKSPTKRINPDTKLAKALASMPPLKHYSETQGVFDITKSKAFRIAHASAEL